MKKVDITKSNITEQFKSYTVTIENDESGFERHKAYIELETKTGFKGTLRIDVNLLTNRYFFFLLNSILNM